MACGLIILKPDSWSVSTKSRVVPDQVEGALLVDDHAHAAGLELGVVLVHALVEGELVAQARAAAAHHLEAQGVGLAACPPCRGGRGCARRRASSLRSRPWESSRTNEEKIGETPSESTDTPWGARRSAQLAAAGGGTPRGFPSAPPAGSRPRRAPRARATRAASRTSRDRLRAQRVVAHHAALAHLVSCPPRTAASPAAASRRRGASREQPGQQQAQRDERDVDASPDRPAPARRPGSSPRALRRSSTTTRGSSRSFGASWP